MTRGVRLAIGILGALALTWMGAQLGGWWERRGGQPQVITVEVTPATGAESPPLGR